MSEDWGVESVNPSQSSSGNSSFKRVVYKVNNNARCRCCLWVVALWCAATVMFMLIGYDLVVEKVAVGHMVLQEGGGPKYEAWRQAPMPVYYKVTVFNLTNPESFMKGARPRLKECGPYTYRMMEEKIDVKFHDNDTVTYRTKPMYVFEYDLSSGVEDDIIWTVNIPLVNAADAVKNSVFLKTVLKVVQNIHGFKTLRQLSVRELLWGYQSHVMDWARTLQDVPYPHPQFGLLVGFNNTPQEPYTMYTGASDPNFMNTIYSWNGKTKLNFWSGDFCNEIRGTDASGFHPGVKQTDKLHVFNGQLCRSLPLIYNKTVVHSGVETYRFVPPPDTFSYGPGYPHNSCFCGPKGCPAQGLLDMKPCYWGAAIAFSFPHFYQSDPVLTHVVQGLRPDAELHGTQFDIYPKLGVPLRVKLRMQMNVVIDSNQALQRDRHFDVVFPVFWFEAGIDSLPVEMVGMLKMAQDLPSVVKTTSVTVCTALSVIFLFLLLASTFAGWCGITPKSSRAPSPEHLPETAWAANHAHRTHAFLDASGYRAGSMTSLAPGDSCGTVLPPYRKSFCPHDETDNFANNTFDIPPSEDQPPAYTSANETKASSPSLVSVQIHNSASIHSLNAPPTPSEILEDEFYIKRSSPDSDNGCFEGKVNPHTVIPTTPPPPIGTPIIAPLAKIENTNVEDPPIEEPLATSSPHESPNTTTTMNSDFPQMNSDEPIMSPSLANRRPTYQNSPKPPPLESDL